jgi:hypothetical protein
VPELAARLGRYRRRIGDILSRAFLHRYPIQHDQQASVANNFGEH